MVCSCQCVRCSNYNDLKHVSFIYYTIRVIIITAFHFHIKEYSYTHFFTWIKTNYSRITDYNVAVGSPFYVSNDGALRS